MLAMNSESNADEDSGNPVVLVGDLAIKKSSSSSVVLSCTLVSSHVYSHHSAEFCAALSQLPCCAQPSASRAAAADPAAELGLRASTIDWRRLSMSDAGATLTRDLKPSWLLIDARSSGHDAGTATRASLSAPMGSKTRHSIYCSICCCCCWWWWLWLWWCW